jgi:hypothetical protein
VLSCPQYEYTGIDSTTGEWTFNENVPRANTARSTQAQLRSHQLALGSRSQTLSPILACQLLTRQTITRWLRRP